MIKSESSSGSAGNRPSSLSACWETDPETRAVRFELPDGEATVFPYIHLVCLRFKAAGEDDSIVIQFASHEVEIRGRRLRKLLLALQKLSVDWVQPLPLRHGAAETGNGLVLAIEVREREREADEV